MVEGESKSEDGEESRRREAGVGGDRVLRGLPELGDGHGRGVKGDEWDGRERTCNQTLPIRF